MMKDQAEIAPKPAEPATLEPDSPAVARFRSCRWRKPAEGDLSEHCTHRDVMPMAGTRGFKAEAWCPDCAFYKLRRTPRRPENY